MTSTTYERAGSEAARFSLDGTEAEADGGLFGGDAPASASASESGVTIDEALQSSVGEFGAGQRLFYCLTQLAWFPAAAQTLVMVFCGIDPVALRWFECAPDAPDAAQCAELVNGTGPPWAKFCALEPGSHSWTRPHDSIVSEWGLTCEERWKQQAVNSGFFVGFLVGAGLFGSMSDRVGRKRALFVALVLAGASGLACGLAGTYWLYFAARLLTGVGVAGVGLVAYVLGCEYVGPSWRGLLGVAAQYFFASGIIALTVFAYLAPSWRGLCFATGGVTLAYTAVLLLVPESPRWQLTAGRPAEAAATLQQIASWNGTSVPSHPLRGIAEKDDDAGEGTGRRKRKPGMEDVARHPVLLGRLVVQVVAWFSISCTYYGISLMVADLPGSLYVNNLALASVEIVAYLVCSLLLDRLGRRWTIAGSYILGGVCLAISSCLHGPASIAFAIIAKLGAAAAFAAIFIYAAELFPTVVRAASMGLMSQAARVGGIFTPSLILLGHTINFPLFGFLVLGIMNTVAGVLLLTQPETLGAVLPDTIDDVPRRLASASGTPLHADSDETRLIGADAERSHDEDYDGLNRA